MPSFCLNRIRPHVRVRSPPVQTQNDAKTDQKNENSGDVIKPVKPIGRKIMIVVDSSMEAKGALQWALTHTVQSHDMVILLHVTKPSNPAGYLALLTFVFLSVNSIQSEEKNSKNVLVFVAGEVTGKKIAPRVSEFLESMKNMCQQKRPEVGVI